jgi:hypothetical protein
MKIWKCKESKFTAYVRWLVVYQINNLNLFDMIMWCEREKDRQEKWKGFKLQQKETRNLKC